MNSTAKLFIEIMGRMLLLSCLHLLVPALFPILNIKEQFRGRGMKNNFPNYAAFLFFLASYSINTDHINPANSLATATTALQGSLPRLTSLR